MDSVDAGNPLALSATLRMLKRFIQFCFLIQVCVSFRGQLLAAALIKNCTDDAPRVNWSVGGYYSVSPDGYWFGGVYAGGEYFLLDNFSAGASLSPGFGDGYFYLAPSVEASYYFWQSGRFEMIAAYSFRYFYDWPLKKGDAESSGTFHGPGISGLYGFSEQLYAGVNVSYQWVRFGGETLREWYFTLPVVWLL